MAITCPLDDILRRSMVLFLATLLVQLTVSLESANSHHDINNLKLVHPGRHRRTSGSPPTAVHNDDIDNIRGIEVGSVDNRRHDDVSLSESPPGRRSNSEAADSSQKADGRERWPPSQNCTQCSARQVKREYLIESIKSEILRKLRLSRPPNVTVPKLPAIPLLERMVDKQGYHADQHWPGDASSEENDLDDDHATTLNLMLFSYPANGSENAFKFRFQPDLRRKDIVKATLGIYTRHNANTRLDNQPRMILLYRLGRRQRIMATNPRKIHISSSSLNHWHMFNIRRLVNDWIDDPSSNHGLEVQATDSNGNPLVVVNPTDPNDEPFKPYLMIHVKEQTSAQIRAKRYLNDCDEFSAERRCCRYPLVVDFVSFGWDWVIVPRQYSAYYCSGECSFLHHQTYSHSHLSQQHSSSSNAVHSTSCCSPRKVSAISMLHYDEHMNIVYGRLPGMVVEQCGCS